MAKCPKELILDVELVRPVLERFIRREVEGAGLEGVVLGISGGVDSATAAGLAAAALGAENVTGLWLPYHDRTDRDDAFAVIEKTRAKLGDDVLVGVGSVLGLDEEAKLREFKAFVDDVGMCVQVGGNPDEEASYEVANRLGSPVLSTAIKGFRVRFREDWDEARLASIVSRDCMIGVAMPDTEVRA